MCVHWVSIDKNRTNKDKCVNGCVSYVVCIVYVCLSIDMRVCISRYVCVNMMYILCETCCEGTCLYCNICVCVCINLCVHR